MGKTTLALELNKSVMQNGIFIYGECNVLQSEPYSAIIEAVEMFCEIIALEDSSTIKIIVLSCKML